MDFSYTAITKDGHRENATIQAPNIAAAGHLLKEQGLLPLEIRASGKSSLGEFFKNAGTIALGEKISFVENLSVMLKAGIPLSRSLTIIVKQTRNAKFKGILQDIYSQVVSGKSLGDALGKYPAVFSNIFQSMIKVGELSGNLEKSLEYLSNQLQREAALKSKTRSAMIYPSVIIGAMFIIGIFMAIFVLPNLTSTFKQFGGQLPLATRVVIVFSDFMSGHAIIVIGGLVALFGFLIYFYNTKPGQRAFDFFMLHLFIINTIVKKINLARFARILSSLLKSGIPIVQSLEVASNSLGNVYFQELTAQASVDVKLGKPIAQSLGKDEKLFPVLVIQMLEVGEESGTLEVILQQLAEHYEEEVDTTLGNLSSIIEPLLLLVIGGVVGFLALALIAPIYSIGQNIQ